jgi:hypothetical protein
MLFAAAAAATFTAAAIAGAWVPATTGYGFSIPSKDVMFMNNLIVNPNNASAMWSQFSVSMSQPICIVVTLLFSAMLLQCYASVTPLQ